MKKVLLSSFLAFGFSAAIQAQSSVGSANEQKNAISEFPFMEIGGKLNGKVSTSEIENGVKNAGDTSNASRILAPDCATLVSPANASVGSIYNPVLLRWTKPSGTITGYDLYIGLHPDALLKLGTSNTTGANVGGTTPDTTYYWKAIAKSPSGDAVDCETWSFTTMSTLDPYCGPIASFSISPMQAITFVNFKANVEKTSSVTADTPHENFKDHIFKVEKGAETTISVNSNTGTGKKHYYTVFVDWNQNGNFNDAGESYFTTTPYFSNLGSDGVDASKIVTSVLAVPEAALLGKTRMRIKAVEAPVNGPLSGDLSNMTSPCNNAAPAIGQAEDYTIEVVPKGSMAVDNVNKSNVSVYPNPFKDVLKISDIKGVSSIMVSDVSGRKLIEAKPTNDLNLSQLKKGIYIVNIKYASGELKSIKVIKE
ncbi:Por secretion system C-terminal sorting domain-containing protein [Soonwooa buanensis]|uniref:Por secretion system C-terminal sorting domain-containing protein n=1 Tax=Soonwooa buanensis TaxID=619805 RepID=A0A1T5FPE2_9FLAO|nr:GEVED domain-containing protein [Soonwooa buanensis]SKB98035.1 Por secretion system C-terminal sorting domain-containing protein [Soonwooa buanensis]